MNHTYHCAVKVSGPYSYERGPTGPAVEHFRIANCTIKNAHHRGVAFYSVCHSGVYDTRIENTAAEGIDFDHFCYHCEAVGNDLRNCRNIELNDASYCLITRNKMTRCSAGIVVWQWCKQGGLNVHNMIVGNHIVESRSDGIRCQTGADHNMISRNTVKNARGTGIVVAGVQNTIVGNAVEGSGAHGILVTGSGNTVLRNMCVGSSRAKSGKFKDIVVQGTGNHVED